MNTETILLACVGLCFPQAASRSDEASEIRHQASGTARNRVRGSSRDTPSEKRASSRPACSAGNLPAFLPRTDKAAVNRQRATDKTWGQLLREEGFLRS